MKQSKISNKSFSLDTKFYVSNKKYPVFWGHNRRQNFLDLLSNPFSILMLFIEHWRNDQINNHLYNIQLKHKRLSH